ncbi:MAG: hypothetical protein HY237_03075 [Acidobacteria bacterium]|nr:hypothetical protein [Acidobacteriota bacterium]
MRPGTVGRKADELICFDTRFLDNATAHELLRLLPKLVHVRRAWGERFRQRGCLVCRRKKVAYGCGGLCNRCLLRTYSQLRVIVRKQGEGRDPAAETAALTRKLDAAQRLLH